MLATLLLAAITDVWAGHATHPAVVNPVSYERFGRPATVISLAGEWDLRTAPHGSGLKTTQYVNDLWTGKSRKVLVPSCWEAQGVGEPVSADWDCRLYCGSTYFVKEGTNRVYAVGETIPAKFRFANFETEPRKDAVLDWALVADGRTLRSGNVVLGDQPIGNAREVAEVPIVVPAVEKPFRAEIVASVGPTCNAWPVWIFPAAKPVGEEGVVVAAFGSSEAAAARAAGKNLLVLANQTGPANITMGWWNIGAQVGTAFLPHAALGDFPYEPYLSPLHFRILKEGTKLPVEGCVESDYIAVGEGCKDAYLYLAAKERADGSREVFVSGIDITSDRIESVTLRNGLINWLKRKG